MSIQNRIATILQYGQAMGLEGYAAGALEEIKCNLSELESAGVDVGTLIQPVAPVFFPSLLSFARYIEETHLMLHKADAAESFHGCACDASLGALAFALCEDNGVDLEDDDGYCLKATAQEICEYNIGRINNFVPTDLDATVERMKREIAQDVRAARVPSDVASFGDLHNHVDANEYGGFCIDEVADAMIAQFGGRDEHEGMPQKMMDYINAAHERIQEWIVAGGIAAVDRPKIAASQP